MTDTFQIVFNAIKAHSTEILEEFDELLPDEGAYNRIIENILMEAFAKIQEDVREYNATMNESKFDSTLELIEIDELEC